MTTPFPFQSAAVLTSAQMNAITTLPINDQTASYTALVGDVGKRIMMNVATANTVTINNSVFAVGDTIFIANKGAGTTTITAGAGVTINGTLTLAQHGGGTLVALSASVFSFFSGGGQVYGAATGGTQTSITVSSVAYTLLTFTTDANFVVGTAGLFDVCLVGGGGGSQQPYSAGYSSGGGGGGGVIGASTISTFYFPAGTYAVDVGAGGSSTAGAVSAIALICAVIGGGRGATLGEYNQNGSSGGGGGAVVGISISPLYGKNAGASTADNGSSGGGGVISAGGSGSGTTGGSGGNGIDISGFIGAGSAYYAGAGGGGGGGGTGGSAGNGGVAGKTSGVANAGVNYGAGGGGTSGASAGGAGAAGAVLIRFKT